MLLVLNVYNFFSIRFFVCRLHNSTKPRSTALNQQFRDRYTAENHHLWKHKSCHWESISRWPHHIVLSIERPACRPKPPCTLSVSSSNTWLPQSPRFENFPLPLAESALEHTITVCSLLPHWTSHRLPCVCRTSPDPREDAVQPSPSHLCRSDHVFCPVFFFLAQSDSAVSTTTMQQLPSACRMLQLHPCQGNKLDWGGGHAYLHKWGLFSVWAGITN